MGDWNPILGLRNRLDVSGSIRLDVPGSIRLVNGRREKTVVEGRTKESDCKFGVTGRKGMTRLYGSTKDGVPESGTDKETDCTWSGRGSVQCGLT